MKNIFKFFGLTLLAGCLMLASCGKEKYTITVNSNNDAWGAVTGGGSYEDGATVTLTATPADGYVFVKWNDDNTDNPRTITVSGDATYTATFESASGVAVTFGNEQWNAQNVDAELTPNAVIVNAYKAGQQKPYIEMSYQWESGNIPTGTHSGAPAMTVNGNSVSISLGNPYVWYFENSSWDLQSTSGGTLPTGDWWGKQVSMNIKAFDADAMTGTIEVNATMAHVLDLLNENGQLTSVDFNDCEARNLTVNVLNQSFTQHPSKGMVKDVVYKF